VGATSTASARGRLSSNWPSKPRQFLLHRELAERLRRALLKSYSGVTGSLGSLAAVLVFYLPPGPSLMGRISSLIAVVLLLFPWRLTGSGP
jgi:hypothetical protein